MVRQPALAAAVPAARDRLVHRVGAGQDAGLRLGPDPSRRRDRVLRAARRGIGGQAGGPARRCRRRPCRDVPRRGAVHVVHVGRGVHPAGRPRDCRRPDRVQPAAQPAHPADDRDRAVAQLQRGREHAPRARRHERRGRARQRGHRERRLDSRRRSGARLARGRGAGGHRRPDRHLGRGQPGADALGRAHVGHVRAGAELRGGLGRHRDRRRRASGASTRCPVSTSSTRPWSPLRRGARR